MALVLSGCDSAYKMDGTGDRYDGIWDDAKTPEGASFDEGSTEEGGGQQVSSGILTAGEWNDLDNWDFWGNLMTTPEPPAEGASEEEKQQARPDYGKMAEMWGFNTSRRVAVHVQGEDGTPAANVKVQLYQGQTLIWSAKTTNEGNAQLWQDLFSARGQESTSEASLSISIEGEAQDNAPVVSSWDAPAVINNYTFNASSPASSADIAFIVDATGSMTDEINFLKKDLLSILEDLSQSQSGVTIRTGAVFYRDEGDTYVTRSDNFTTPSKTLEFVEKQRADGGGDLPEAVHTALATTLQKLSWDNTARSRMAFLILDAPAHGDRKDVIESLQKSIKSFSELGIRIIPVMASNYDKTGEFMCRDFAIVTGGTYVFLTDDSGVGESHMEPTVGEFEVEKLRDLLLRLMNEYVK